ncbi:MAG: glycosyltransferase [Polyangiaceae bacterium]|nr:glycosyltransferase [Polyangiaceae bacterium]
MQFHILSFEGPDPYSRAGGISSRITGLTASLAKLGYQTHLWFVGDPFLPGHEQQGALHLHRWCQWISRHHPRGVYDGECGKVNDYAASVPPHLLGHHLLPHLRAGGRATVLAEEWHTVHAVRHLDWLLKREGLRHQVDLLWNANNTFGFEGIDWAALTGAAQLTTVSRYMKHKMWSLGVDPLVVPNGIDEESLKPPEFAAVQHLRQQLSGRPFLTKVARWDPDKRWLLAVDTVALLKARGQRPLLVARGGLESHAREVIRRAQAQGLSVVERSTRKAGAEGVLRALEGVAEADIVLLQSHLDPAGRRLLFRAADAVLANSGHEPFGLVGLETMAAGGIACTGSSGEDYAIPGQNALVLETNDPSEFVRMFEQLEREPGRARMLRRAARSTALGYTWSKVIDRVLLPRLAAEEPPSRPSGIRGILDWARALGTESLLQLALTQPYLGKLTSRRTQA